MKKTLYFIFGLGIMALGMSFDGPENAHAIKYNTGAPEGHTGSPGDNNANCRACHASPAAQTVADWITSNIPSTGYVPGQTYTVTVTSTGAGHSRFGFQVSPQNTSGALRGTIVKTSNTTVLVGNNKYITHSSSGTSGSGGKTWTFDWVAPAAGSGDVTFYGAFNVANNDGGTLGDTILLSTLAVKEGTLMSVTRPAKKEAGIRISPNPVNGSANVELSGFPTGNIDIVLMDVQGRKVANLYSGTGDNGFNRKMDFSAYPKGIYFMVALNNGVFHSMEKVIVQ